MISVKLLNDDSEQFCKQYFLIVDLKVDSNLWTPVYVCESLQGQAAKTYNIYFESFLYVIVTVSENKCMDIKGLCS